MDGLSSTTPVARISMSDSSDQDSPTSLVNHNFTMPANNSIPDSSSFPLGCVGRSEQSRRGFDRGHHTMVVHSPGCSTPDPLMCMGECRFKYDDVMVNTARTKWRRRKLTIVCSMMVVLGVAVLSALGAGIHYWAMSVTQTDTVQDVVATSLKHSSEQYTTPSFVSPTTPVLRSLAITELPLEYPEDVDWIMATNDIVESYDNDETGDSYN